MTDVATLDAMPREAAAELLRACCGSTRWVNGMLARRPFHATDAALAAAGEVWSSLGETDWREAFAHHPRLGERQSAAPQDARAMAWSSSEQAGMQSAADELRTALAKANRSYEERFGHICIICATGLGPIELLTLTEDRLTNPPDVELAIAAEEQRKITRLRLLKLFHEPPGAAPT